MILPLAISQRRKLPVNKDDLHLFIFELCLSTKANTIGSQMASMKRTTNINIEEIAVEFKGLLPKI